MTDLEQLLAEARDASPADRLPMYRGSIAAHGAAAIEPMRDWLGDHRLMAFAIRVLERIGLQPAERDEVVNVLAEIDRTELPAHLVGDLDRAIAALRPPGARRTGARSGPRPGSTNRPGSLPGIPGRGYWVMRTSPWERPFLWSEAQAGRLRQGWGAEDDQNLEIIAETIERGGQLSESQKEARRGLRMLTSWHDGMRVGDIVVVPNLPAYGRVSIFRVAGSYEWSRASAHTFGERFGHVLPVEMVLADADRYGDIPDELRAVLGGQSRLYSIRGYGGYVERVIGGDVQQDHRGDLWTEDEYALLFGRFPPDGARCREHVRASQSAGATRRPLGNFPRDWRVLHRHGLVPWRPPDRASATFCGLRSTGVASHIPAIEPMVDWELAAAHQRLRTIEPLR